MRHTVYSVLSGIGFLPKCVSLIAELFDLGLQRRQTALSGLPVHRQVLSDGVGLGGVKSRFRFQSGHLGLQLPHLQPVIPTAADQYHHQHSC